jgi:peptidoglycan/LPS O-acetylase OafA/YrhL
MMQRRWTPLLVWAGLLAGLTCLQFVFTTNPYYWATLGGAALATALLAGYYLWRPPLRAEEYVPDSSYATVAVAVGAAIAVVGVPFGPWLYLPGLGLLVVGLGGLVHELRVERRRA